MRRFIAIRICLKRLPNDHTTTWDDRGSASVQQPITSHNRSNEQFANSPSQQRHNDIPCQCCDRRWYIRRQLRQIRFIPKPKNGTTQQLSSAAGEIEAAAFPQTPFDSTHHTVHHAPASQQRVISIHVTVYQSSLGGSLPDDRTTKRQPKQICSNFCVLSSSLEFYRRSRSANFSFFPSIE